jgi:5-methylcytosine-specific restriction endonuclease McrA
VTAAVDRELAEIIEQVNAKRMDHARAEIVAWYQSGAKVAQIASWARVRATVITRILHEDLERTCARGGCQNPVTGSLARQYCGERECTLARQKEADRERNRGGRRQRVPAGKNGGTCSVCGKPVWRDNTSAGAIICQPCRRIAKGLAPDQLITRSAELVRQEGPFTCEQCLAQFMGRPSTVNRFCSKDCVNAWRAAQKIRVCEQCGEDYTKRDSGSGSQGGKRRTQRFCSHPCYIAWLRAKCGLSWDEPIDLWPTGKTEPSRECSECGAGFISDSPTRLTCSPVCKKRRGSRISSEATMARYYADPAFRDEVLTRAMNRRVSLLGIPGLTRPWHLVAYLFEADNGICGICGGSVVMAPGPHQPSPDHVIPLARGGKHELSNLQLSHLSCNLSKNAGEAA